MKSLGFGLRGGRASLRVFCATVALMSGGVVQAADEVSFTLTFSDRPLPDLRSFTALRAGGSAVRDVVDHHPCGRIGAWFMRAIYYHRLPMKYTFAGYAQHRRWYYDWSKVKGTLSTDELSERATEICMAIQKRELEYQKEYGPKITEQETFVNVQATCLPTGSPFPFELPKAKGACDSEVVWDGVFADLLAQFGPDEEKRKILEVEVEYEKSRRFLFGGKGFPGFYDWPVGARFTYRAGAGGEVIARMEVKYPGWFFGCGYSGEDATLHYHDPLTIFTLGEWQKESNRGRTITGRFAWNGPERPWRIFVEGEKGPELEFAWRSLSSVSRQSKKLARCLGGDEACRVTNLSAWALRSCYELKRIKLPTGLRDIPEGLFYRGWRFQESNRDLFVVPEGVERIGKYAFYNNCDLREVRVPKSMKVIDDYAFCNCISLTNVIFEGESRPKIGEGAFRGCEKLKGL